MFPSEDDPLFGVFVKNFKNELEKQGVEFPRPALIKGKTNSKTKKLINYITHYIKIILSFFMYDYDLVYAHYLSHHIPILYILLPFKKKPLIVNVHGSDIISIKENSLLDRYATKILRKTDLLIVPTSYFKQAVLNKYPFIKEEQLFISPSGGIDSSNFYKKDRTPNKVLTLGYISRFIKEKGWQTFLDALVLLKQENVSFKAVMAGKGPDETKIMDYIKAYHLSSQVSFLGLVKQNELVDVYNSLDLYIFPTYREAESLGLTGLEAMSCGVPVIASNMAGPSTYVENGFNGFLFEPKDSFDLHKKIIQFKALDENLKSSYIQNAINTGKKYEVAYINSILVDKLSDIIKHN